MTNAWTIIAKLWMPYHSINKCMISSFDEMRCGLSAELVKLRNMWAKFYKVDNFPLHAKLDAQNSKKYPEVTLGNHGF